MTARTCSNTCGGGQSCDCPLPPEAASACTELGAEPPPCHSRPRLGATGRRHAWLMRHQLQIGAVISMLAFTLLLFATRP